MGRFFPQLKLKSRGILWSEHMGALKLAKGADFREVGSSCLVVCKFVNGSFFILDADEFGKEWPIWKRCCTLLFFEL